MIRGIVLACLLLTPLVLVATGAAQDKKDIKGAVQEIDPVVGTITLIEAEGKAQSVKTYGLARPDIPVRDAADKPLKLADLSPDDRVYLKMAGDDVIAIRKALPTVFGTLTKLDVAARYIVLKTKLGDKTIPFTSDVKVISNKEPAELKDLKVQAPLLVTFSQDHRTVVELRAGKGVVAGQKLSKGVGSIIEYDPDKRTVLLLGTTTFGDYYPLRDLALSHDATFALLHHAKPFRDLTGAELSRGVKVYYWVDTLTHKVAHVQVEMPILGKRVVKSFDPTTRSLVLEDSAGERKLTLSQQAKVRNARGVARLEEIKAGANVSCGLSPDRRLVELVTLYPK